MKIESTFKNKDFEALVANEAKKNKAEVFAFEYENKKFWVKKARATKSNIFHRFFYKLSSIDVMLPVENKNAKEALLFETDKLIEFYENGINTAKVVGRNNTFFVLEDSGKNVYHYLRKRDNNIDGKFFVLNKTLLLLSKIHNNGFYHGGAQIRNFTVYNDEIFTIDLEDSFDSKIDLKTLQFRDFFLFLLSLLKLKNRFNFDFNKVIYNYIELTNNKDFINKLKKKSQKLSFIMLICRPFMNVLPKDAINFIELLEILKNLEEK